jgi:hypothetical protein
MPKKWVAGIGHQFWSVRSVRVPVSEWDPVAYRTTCSQREKRKNCRIYLKNKGVSDHGSLNGFHGPKSSFFYPVTLFIFFLKINMFINY